MHVQCSTLIFKIISEIWIEMNWNLKLMSNELIIIYFKFFSNICNYADYVNWANFVQKWFKNRLEIIGHIRPNLTEINSKHPQNFKSGKLMTDDWFVVNANISSIWLFQLYRGVNKLYINIRHLYDP
jgi:hypothetical protein